MSKEADLSYLVQGRQLYWKPSPSVRIPCCNPFLSISCNKIKLSLFVRKLKSYFGV